MKLRITHSYKMVAFVLLGLIPLATNAQQKKLSLEEAITLAKTNNAEIKSSSLDIEKAQQQRIVSRSLLLPSITASAAVNHYFELPPFFGFGDNAEDGKIPYGRLGGEDQLAAGVQLIQPLYNPQAYPSIKRSRLQERESEISFKGKEIEVVASVQQTYLTILVLEQRIRLQEESITRNKRVLKDSRSLYAQGKALRVDTLRAFTDVKNLEPVLVQLVFAAEKKHLQLKTLLGIDSLQSISLTDSLSVPDPSDIPDEATVYQTAKTNNPEYQVLGVREDIGSESIRVASGLHKPVVAAVGQYQVVSQTNNLEFNNAHYPGMSYVGLQVSVPLFTGLGNQAKVKQAQAAYQQSTLVRQYSEENLRSVVHEVIARNRESAARLENTRTVLETAQLSYNIIQYRYQSGIASRLELTDAELALSTSQVNYLEAIYDYLTAQIQLNKLMGISG